LRVDAERHFRGAEFPVAAPHQYRQDRRGDLFRVRRRADEEHRPVLRTGPLQGRQGHRAGTLKRQTCRLLGPNPTSARPAKAGTHSHEAWRLDSRLRGNERSASYTSSTTVLRRTPICGAATSTTSPGLSHTEGFRCTPAPVGVPVQIKSPGLSVAKVLM